MDLADLGAFATLRVAAADLNGQMRGKRVPGSYGAKLEGGAVRMPYSALNVDLWGADVVGSPAAGFHLDYASISRVEVTAPGDPDSGSAPFCTILGTNGTGHFDAERTAEVGAFRGAERPGPTTPRRPMTTSSDDRVSGRTTVEGLQRRV